MRRPRVRKLRRVKGDPTRTRRARIESRARRQILPDNWRRNDATFERVMDRSD